MNGAPSVAAFAVATLRRDLRAGELRLIAVALLVAVASVTAVEFFVDRVRGAMERDAGALLGGDLAIESAAPIPPEFLEQARELGLATATTAAFASVIGAGDRLQLTEVKAVDSAYPLRGTVAIATAPFAAAREVAGGPPAGELWADQRLLTMLGVGVGDSVDIGAIRLRIGAVLLLEPDRGGDLFNVAPRTLMNRADLPASRLILPGSRVNWRLLAAGDTGAIAAYRRWTQDRIAPGIRIRGVHDARPELTSALDRAGQFLGLAALVAVLTAGVAIALVAARYVQRRYDACAIMRCLGATQDFVIRTHALALAILAIGAGLAGSALGFVAQFGLARIVAPLTAGTLPAPSARPVLTGLVIALVTLGGFSLLALMRLRDIAPLRVLRRDLAPPPRLGWLYHGLAFAVVIACAPWSAREPRLTLLTAAGCLGAVAVLALLARLLVLALGHARNGAGVAWRFGVANVARRAGTSVLQAVALGLGIMVMILLALVRGDLLEGWRARLPPDAPNRFLINIQPDEVGPLRDWFTAEGLPAPEFFPMVRARLVERNGEPIDLDAYSDPRARRMADREFNLSWANTAQPDNRIVAGTWWSGDRPAPQFSFEQDIAHTLGLALGDELTYLAADQRITGRITSLRKVEWDSFNVNFFVVSPPGMLESLPATWITAFRLDDGAGERLVHLVRRFPSVTVIDIEALEQHVRRVMDQVSLAVQYVFGFTILAGLVVLYAGVTATHDERVREIAVLRTLGARDGVLRAGVLAELAVLGALCGAVAAVGASVAGALLARQVFSIPFEFDPLILPVSIAAGVVGVAAVGWLGVRPALRATALESLRR
ncbi:MAG: ABC transporter permease [Gammaproteobacteria bacterium]